MHTATILVVEDNPITRKMVRVALASEGYAVLEAPDGQTALDLMTRYAPDLVLQDLLLPDIDGFELVQRLRALPHGAAVPLLAISGFLSQAEQVRSLQVGFTDYLFKPVEPSHLLSTVHAYLRQPARDERPGRGHRILVVDDDPVQLKLLRVHLEQQGFEVATAEDGADALAQARSTPPEAIVSDVLMPRLDGFRLCLSVRQDPRLAGVPVILTSAVYTEEVDHHLARSVGANGFTLRTPDHRETVEALLACLGHTPPPPDHPIELPLEEYTHRVIRQLEHQVGLSANLTRRLALLEAELGILARILETLRSTSAPEGVVTELLHRCLDAAGISRGAAYLLDSEGRLNLEARLGYPDAAAGRLADYFGHAGLLRRVLEQGEPVELTASRPDGEGAAALLAMSGAQSILLTPLVWGDQRLGVLEIASANRELGADWLAFAKGIGNQIGQALELARTISRLNASEQRYRDLIHGLDVVVWEADAPNRRTTFVSQRAEAILGYPIARWLTEPDFWESIIHPEDRSEMVVLCRQALDEGRDVVLEYRAVGANKQVVWFRDMVSVVRDAGERVPRLRGVMVDITDRKRSEQRLAAEHATTSILAESASLEEATPRILQALCQNLGGDFGAIWGVDAQAGVLRCIEIWQAPGFHAQELEAVNRQSTFGPGVGLPGLVWASGEARWVADYDRARHFPRAAVAAREHLRTAFCFPIRTGNRVVGVIEFFSREIQHPDDDLIRMMAAIGSQVGQFLERKRAEEALREGEALLRAVVEGTTDAIFVKDLQGRYLLINPAGASLLGKSVEDILGKEDRQMFAPESSEQIRARDRQVLEGGQAQTYEEVITAAGVTRTYLSMKAPYQDSQGQVHGLIGISRDITEHKRMEEQEVQLRLAQAVQQGYFPTAPPRLAGFDIGGASFPAAATGGDYYDYLPLAGGSLGLVIGDASGHGFGPALRMSEVRAYLRAWAATHADIGQIAGLLNAALTRGDAETYFVTLLLAELSPGTRSFRYVSAGHAKGYVLGRPGEVKAVLDSTGMPLGISPEACFAVSNWLPLEENDLVLFLTDGVVEARCSDGSLFGNRRALDTVWEYRDAPARQIVEKLYHAVRSCCQGRPQNDDITAVVLKVEAAC